MENLESSYYLMLTTWKYLQTKRGFEDLVKKLKAEGLKVKVEGPLERNHGSIGFLKRTFTATLEGVEISMNAKYVESLEEVLELEKAFARNFRFPQMVEELFTTRKEQTLR